MLNLSDTCRTKPQTLQNKMLQREGPTLMIVKATSTPVNMKALSLPLSEPSTLCAVRVPRGIALPSLHLRLGPGPGPVLPCHLVHVLEPLLRLCTSRGKLPQREPQPESEDLHRAPLLLRRLQGGAWGAAAAAPRGGPNRHHDLQRLLLLLEYFCGKSRKKFQSLGGAAWKFCSSDQTASSHPFAPVWGWWLTRCVSYVGTLIPASTYKEISLKIVGKKLSFKNSPSRILFFFNSLSFEFRKKSIHIWL